VGDREGLVFHYWFFRGGISFLILWFVMTFTMVSWILVLFLFAVSFPIALQATRLCPFSFLFLAFVDSCIASHFFALWFTVHGIGE
jgi:hypothetical protein